MQAFQVAKTGAPAALRQVAIGEPGPGQVRVEIRAAGLNFADLLMVQGRYQDMPAPPFTLGMELAGIVRQAGPDVGGPAPGDRVAVFAGSGGLAEAGNFDAARCTPMPDAMSFEEAAAFQIAYGTSHLALTRRARLAEGETLLVLGAAGGVGLTAVELGKVLGARVIAVARGADKLAAAARAGADHLIDSDTADITQAVRALGGADVVYDPVGGDQFGAALRACRPEARILAIGFASGELPQIPTNHLLVKNVEVIGFYWGGYLKFRPEALTASMGALFDLYAQGRIRPHISHRLPLDRADEALDILASRKATGKIVVTMPGRGVAAR